MKKDGTITNAEYMISVLRSILEDEKIEVHPLVHDDWASEEAMVYYNIACPYYVGDERAECKNNGPLETATREQCFRCKYDWLTNQVDE
jgi:hypothetical protein